MERLFSFKLSGRQVSVSAPPAYTLLVAIKAFWKWMKGSDDEFPPEVRWIQASGHGSNLPRINLSQGF
jgi:hypothetical protein